jgi:hypothetical protein
MNRLITWACVVLVWGVLPALAAATALKDAAHPELWGDWRKNPYVWGPVFLAALGGSTGVALYAAFMDGKDRAERMRRDIGRRGQ